MSMRERKKSFSRAKIIFMILALLTMFGTGWAQTHDLVMENAADYTSADHADWKSPDIKIGSDFGETFPADIVRRGVVNPIYARFYINGTHDYEIPSFPPLATAVKIKFYWRHATAGEIPPAINHASWQPIPGEIPVTYNEAGGEDLYLTLMWPDNFPSVTTKSVDWTPPDTGDYFHVAAEVVYPAGTTDVNPGDNVAVSLYESILGVRDVDVVMVVDTSGSMGSFSFEGHPYMEHAKDKAGLFVYSMPGTGAHKASVVAFNTTYVSDYKDVWPTPVASLQPVTNANKNNIVTAVDGLTSGGATPMGAGLQRAIDILTAVPAAPDRKRAILLLSDGYDNSGTPRACPSTGTCADGGILSQLQANNIRVFSVALGEYAWTDCLECLATNSGGQWYGAVDPGVDLAEVLLDMQQAYTADDLYRADRGVSGGGDDTYAVYFEGKDNVLYFILAWEDLGKSLGLQLHAPGTRSVLWINPERNVSMTANRGKGYLVVRVNNPKKGEWEYRVTGENGENYLAAVRSDRVGVSLGIDAVSVGTAGYPIEITARLMDGKKPVESKKVMATVQIPMVSMEGVLLKAARAHMVRAKTPPVDPKVLAGNPDVTARSVFIDRIKTETQQPLVKTRTVEVPLKHIGKGIYKGVLKENYTTVAGKYNITVTCIEKTYQRNYTKHLRLRPGKLDFNKSSYDILPLKTNVGESWLFCVYPSDKFGNPITCPSLTKRIKANLVLGQKFSTPEIVFGTFQQKLSVPRGQKPKLTKVTLDGRLIKKMGDSR